MQVTITDATVRAYDKGCVGCKTHGKDLMLSTLSRDKDGSITFYDIFLTQSQAQSLLNELKSAVDRNKFILATVGD